MKPAPKRKAGQLGGAFIVLGLLTGAIGSVLALNLWAWSYVFGGEWLP